MNVIEEACIRVLQDAEPVTEAICKFTERDDFLIQISQCTPMHLNLFDRILDTAKEELKGCLFKNYIRGQVNKQKNGEGAVVVPPSVQSK